MGLEILNVNKSFNGKKVLENISITMSNPGIFGLLGSNGAGKTTISRIILGILSKDAGKILWNGKNINRKLVNYGYLPEERGLYPKATVKEQLTYFATLKGMSVQNANNEINKWCNILNITEYLHIPSEQLSKGNQQKVQLLTSIIHSPELLILDEPFSGLDPINTKIIKKALYDLVEHGTYIILSAHQMPIIEEFCQDILILDKGVTVLKGNLNEIKNSYSGNNIIVHTSSSIDSLLDKDIEIIAKNGNNYLLNSPKNTSNALLKTLLGNNISIYKFEVKHPSLEDIFIEHVGKKIGEQI
jgi:ABC-2 type transport system ATP-binding protein